MLKAAKSAAFFFAKWGRWCGNRTKCRDDARFSADCRHARALDYGRDETQHSRERKEKIMSAQPNQKKTLEQNQERPVTPAQETPSLDRRYGRIGIGAVAAALQFSNTSREPAAKKASGIEDRFIEMAA
jgi:hypothetical protein